MQLRRLKIERFRAFESAEITLPESGLVLIAGANNSGKSALLSAVDVVAGREIRSPRHHGAEAPAEITAEFWLSDEERASLLGDGEHLARWLRGSDLFRTVVCHFIQGINDRFLLARTGTFAWVEAPDGYPANWQACNVHELSHDPYPQDFVSFDTLGSMSGNASPNDDPLRHGGPFNQLLSHWSQRLYHFNAIRTGAPRRGSTGAIGPDLLPSGENLAECLVYHFSQGSPVWDAVRATMAAVLPDVGELVVPMERAEIEIAFVDPTSGERRNLKDLGSGVEQLLMIAYVGAAHPSDGLVLMEEPETSLHPGAQRELMRHLIDWGADRLFVASTHSPVFLDRRPAEQGTTYLVTRANGASTVRPADDDVRSVLHAVGVQLSDVLSAERIVLVEGESDAGILRAWFPDELLARRSAIVPLGGGDRAYHLDIVTEVLDGVDALGRAVLFIRDRDELLGRRLERLEADQRVLVLARRELENYLLDETGAIADVLDWRASQPGYQAREQFDIDSLACALREEADDLQPVVVLKRVIEEAGALRLLDRATVRQIADDGPSLERLLAVFDASLETARSTRDQMAEHWAAQSAAVEAQWEAKWRSLAPGADVLAAIWRRAGGRYDKAVDGPRLAAAAETPPAEIAEALRVFLS